MSNNNNNYEPIYCVCNMYTNNDNPIIPMTKLGYENEMTILLMSMYGIDCMRGGDYKDKNLSPSQYYEIRDRLNSPIYMNALRLHYQPYWSSE